MGPPQYCRLPFTVDLVAQSAEPVFLHAFAELWRAYFSTSYGKPTLASPVQVNARAAARFPFPFRPRW
jgi:hypothetical protein